MDDKKKKIDLEKLLRNKENEFSIPLQNVIVTDLAQDVKAENFPSVKSIDVKDFQTRSYSVRTLYKPISKLIDFNEK